MEKAKKRLDKIMVVCQESMQGEVSALIGKTMKFTVPETTVISKEDFFSEPAPKSVLAHIQLEGDITGQGCLIVSVRDAIRIGGTLIMLPDSELDKVVADEDYSADLEDSYGEIANIICGVLTTVFNEQYPKKLRFVKTEQEVIVPIKVVVDSNQPVADGSYYLMQTAMELEGVEMGGLKLLLPAENLGLIEQSVPVAEQKNDVGELTDKGVESSVSQTASSEKTKTATLKQESVAEPERTKLQAENDKQSNPEPTEISVEKLEKQRRKVAKILDICLERIGEEVGALLGGTLTIKDWDNGIYSKEELLEQTGGKQVMARMEVRGDQDGEAYLLVSVKDAIYIGGTLIMLPDAKLEEVVRDEEFGEDTQDAYEEITNIIAGVYTTVFEELYRDNIGFVKTGLETIVPIKIDPESDDVIPDEFYFLSAGNLIVNGRKLGRMQAVFPARIFGLEALAQPSVAEQPVVENNVAGQQAINNSEREGLHHEGMAERLEISGAGDSVVDVLIFTDDEVESTSVAALLTNQGWHSKILDYRDQVSNHLTQTVGLVFLIMKEVDEHGFGMAIKLSNSGLRVPLVAGGPAWTRSTVLKAVKYGVSDILITPAKDLDIQEKLNTNMVKKAA